MLGGLYRTSLPLRRLTGSVGAAAARLAPRVGPEARVVRWPLLTAVPPRSLAPCLVQSSGFRTLVQSRQPLAGLPGSQGLVGRRPALADGLLPAAPQLQQRRGVTNKHKKVRRMAKGYRGRGRNCFKIAVQRVQKAMQYAYRDRKTKKREMRRLWIQRMNAACRQHGVNYSATVRLLTDAGVELNRKVLADIAVTEPYSFKAVIDTIRDAAATNAAAARADRAAALPPAAARAGMAAAAAASGH